MVAGASNQHRFTVLRRELLTLIYQLNCYDELQLDCQYRPNLNTQRHQNEKAINKRNHHIRVNLPGLHCCAVRFPADGAVIVMTHTETAENAKELSEVANKSFGYMRALGELLSIDYELSDEQREKALNAARDRDLELFFDIVGVDLNKEGNQ